MIGSRLKVNKTPTKQPIKAAQVIAMKTKQIQQNLIAKETPIPQIKRNNFVAAGSNSFKERQSVQPISQLQLNVNSQI